MTEYPNWFAVTGLENFAKHLGPLSGLRCLQIGVFTGDASVWLLDHVAASLVDVDTWQGSDEEGHAAFDWDDVLHTYHQHVGKVRSAARLTTYRGTSEEFFAIGPVAFCDVSEFDFIYIDGAHDPYSVMRDAVGAWDVLAVGGLIAFDDYNWTPVARAVDAFDSLWGDRLELVESNAQAWFRRVR